MRTRRLLDATASETARQIDRQSAGPRILIDATAGKTARSRRRYLTVSRRNSDTTDPRNRKTNYAAWPLADAEAPTAGGRNVRELTTRVCGSQARTAFKRREHDMGVA
jgi:hypothetical protein